MTSFAENVAFTGYIVLYLNVTDPQRLRFVVTPNIYDGRIDNDGVVFCQGVICDTDEDYASLKNAVKDLDFKYLGEFMKISKSDDSTYKADFVLLLQQTFTEAHAIATRYPWYWVEGPRDAIP